MESTTEIDCTLDVDRHEFVVYNDLLTIIEVNLIDSTKIIINKIGPDNFCIVRLHEQGDSIHIKIMELPHFC